MNILCIGDPHFKVENVPETAEFTVKLIDLIKNTDPDIVVILGDLLHTHELVHTDALNRCCDFIDQIRTLKKTYILVGNHDMINNQQFLTDKHWMNSLKEWDNVTIIDTVLVEETKIGKLCFSPYVPNGRFMDALNTCDNWKESKCIFAHQEFKGCKMGAMISEDGDEWGTQYPLVISGHIHDRQKLPNVIYTGSAMQHAFGDSDDKCILIVTITSDGEKVFKEFDLGLRKKKIIYTNIGCIEDVKIGKEIGVKLSISGSTEELKTFKKSKKYKELSSKGIKVVLKPDKINIKTKMLCVDHLDKKCLEKLHDKIMNSDDKYLKWAFYTCKTADDILIL